MRNHAFTLIELLVVMSILAILAGLIIPGVSVVRNRMAVTKATTNMAQLGTLLTAYRLEHQERFPDHLWVASSATASTLVSSGITDDGTLAKLLACPLDDSKGEDARMGRPAWDQNDLTNLHEPGCSMVYEISGHALKGNQRGWFPTDKAGIRPITWAQGKLNQLLYGNKYSNGAYGNRFPESVFPVVRCFHHVQWGDKGSDMNRNEVLNLFWDLHVGTTIPFWEHQANPLIPFN